MNKKNIVVWFSCGVASAVAAKKTIEIFGKDYNVIIANTPIYEEHHDNLRFLKDVEEWIGQKIEKISNSEFPNSSCVEVWGKRKYMSGIKGAPCTTALKKEARYQYEKQIDIYAHVLGFTYDEIDRHLNFVREERHNLFPVLIMHGITKQKCFDIIAEAQINPPSIYSLGFPNANCIGCVKATSPTYWNLVRKHFPDVFEERAMQSRTIGCRLVRVNNKRIFLDELSPDTNGAKIKSWECGLFCNTK